MIKLDVTVKLGDEISPETEERIRWAIRAGLTEFLNKMVDTVQYTDIAVDGTVTSDRS